MKKLPTLFQIEYTDGHKGNITKNITPGMEWVLYGGGVSTVKFDGACCALIDGELYKRYDAKHGKKPPDGAIPCCDADPITGHHPHWVKVDENNPADKHFIKAYNNTVVTDDTGLCKHLKDCKIKGTVTFEAIGKHFQSNVYDLKDDFLIPHGYYYIDDVLLSFDGIKEYLQNNNIEGIVFWKNNEPQCKIRRKDFGFAWNKDIAKNYPFNIVYDGELKVEEF